MAHAIKSLLVADCLRGSPSHLPDQVLRPRPLLSQQMLFFYRVSSSELSEPSVDRGERYGGSVLSLVYYSQTLFSAHLSSLYKLYLVHTQALYINSIKCTPQLYNMWNPQSIAIHSSPVEGQFQRSLCHSSAVEPPDQSHWTGENTHFGSVSSGAYSRFSYRAKRARQSTH